MKTIYWLLLVITLLGLADSAKAWDGKRKGFTLGLGMGPGVTSFTHRMENLCNDRW